MKREHGTVDRAVEGLGIGTRQAKPLCSQSQYPLPFTCLIRSAFTDLGHGNNFGAVQSALDVLTVTFFVCQVEVKTTPTITQPGFVYVTVSTGNVPHGGADAMCVVTGDHQKHMNIGQRVGKRAVSNRRAQGRG